MIEEPLFDVPGRSTRKALVGQLANVEMDPSVFDLPAEGTQRRRVLDCILRLGLATDQEVQAATGLEGNSERPRRDELRHGGWIRESGHRRDGRMLWEPTVKAYRYWDERLR